MKKSFWTIGVVVILLVIASAIYSWQYINDKNDGTEKTDQSKSSQTDRGPEDDTKKQDKDISKSEAEKIVLDKYGGSIKNTEDDSYHGKSAWEVEVRDSKQGRIEVKVDKKTGEILDMEKD